MSQSGSGESKVEFKAKDLPRRAPSVAGIGTLSLGVPTDIEPEENKWDELATLRPCCPFGRCLMDRTLSVGVEIDIEIEERPRDELVVRLCSCSFWGCLMDRTLPVGVEIDMEIEERPRDELVARAL